MPNDELVGRAQKAVEATRKWGEARKEFGIEKLPPYSPEAKPSRGLRPQSLPSGATAEQQPPTTPGEVGELQNLPQLPPTLARALDKHGLSHKKRDLRAKLAEGGKAAPKERARVIALADRYGRSEVFRKQVDDAFEGKRLSEEAHRRVEKIRDLSQQLAEVPEDQRYPGLLGDIAEQIEVWHAPIGPKESEVRVDLIRNPETGASAVDVQKSFARLQDAYLSRNLQAMEVARDTATPAQIQKALKDATERAADDMIGVALTGRRILMWDPTGKEERISQLADDLPGIRSVRAHLAKVSDKSLFHPTAGDLKKESVLDWIFRMSPMDFQASKLKLIREQIYGGSNEPTDWGKTALAVMSMVNPIVNDIVLEQMGVSAEDQIRQHMEGYTWFEEGQKLQGEAMYQFSKATGATDEEAEHERKTREASKASMALTFIPYLFDPDLITVVTLGVGKANKMTQGTYQLRKAEKAWVRAKKLAENPGMRVDDAIDEIALIHPEVANLLKTHFLSDTKEQGLRKVANLEAKLPERTADMQEAVRNLEKAYPGIDVNNLEDLVKIRNEPNVKEVLQAQVDMLTGAAAEASAYFSRFGAISTIEKKELEALLKASQVAEDATQAVITDGNAILRLIVENPNLRPYVASHNAVTRLKGELRLAKESKDANRIKDVTERLKKAKAYFARARKKVDPAIRDQYLTHWTHGRSMSTKLRNVQTIALTPTLKKSVTKIISRTKAHTRRAADLSVQARTQLRPAAARFYALYPEELAKLPKGRQKAVKTQMGKASPEQIQALAIAGKKDQITQLSNRIKKLAKAQDAARWRETVVRVGDHHIAGLRTLRKDLSWTSFFRPKTGISKLDIASGQQEIISRLTRIGSPIQVAFDVARTTIARGERVIINAPSVSNTATKAERATTATFGLSGKVDAATPGFLHVEDLRIPEKLKGGEFESQYLVEALRLQKSAGQGITFASNLDEVVTPLINAGLPVRRAADGSYMVRAEELAKVPLDEIVSGVAAQGEVLQLKGGPKFRKALEEHYGKEAVQWTVERMGTAGELLEESFKHRPLRLTAVQAERLQFEIPHTLAQASQRLNPETRQMLDALQLIQSYQARPWNAKVGLDRYTTKYLGGILRSFDPFGVRIGENSDEVRNILRAGDNLNDQIIDEIRAIILQAQKAAGTGSAKDRLVLYMDSGRAIPLPKNKTTVMNSGPKTHWQRMKRQVKGWVDTDPANAAYKEAESVGKLVEQNHPSVLGLSRVWLPQKHGTTVEQAGKLYKAALNEINKAATFDEFMEAMRTVTDRILDTNPDTRISRVYMLAAKAVSYGSVHDELAYLARRASGGIITPDEAADATRVLTQDYKNIQDVDKALDTLNRLGIPFSQRRVVPATAAGGGLEALSGDLSNVSEINRKLVRLGTDNSGQAIFAANALRRELATSLNKHIKELYEWSELPRDAASRSVVRSVLRFLHLMRTDATIGIMIPNPGHHVFNRFGDASQMLFSLPGRGGLAARATFQNIWSDIPFIGRRLQDGLSQMSKKLGGKPILKSLTETLFNPHIDDFWRGRSGVLQLGDGGPHVSYDWLRRRSVQDGIMDVFLAEDLADTLRRLPDASPIMGKMKGAPGKALKSWQENIAQFTIATQQRQRIGTWLMLLRDGHSVDDATRLVHESLYDWAHGMSRAELFSYLRVFPYYRFWRLAFGQLSQAALAPITRPTGEVLKNAFTGSTRLNKLRVTMRTQRDLMPWLWDPRSPEEVAAEQGEYEAWARSVYPEWIHPSPVGGFAPIDHADHLAWSDLHGERGSKFTHTVGVLPPATMVDAAEIAMTPMMTAVGAALSVMGETEMADDWMRKSLEPTVDLMYPSFREYFGEAIGSRTPSRGGGMDLTVIQPYEADIVKMMGIQVVEDPETGRLYAPMAAGRTMFRMIPIAGIGVPRLLNAAKYRNPGAAKGLSEGLTGFFLNFSRLYRQYPYNYRHELVNRQRRMSKAVNQRLQRAELEELK